MRSTGTYDISTVTSEEVRAFVPSPLPPANPPLQFDDELTALIASAEAAIQRLELAGTMVPSTNWFLYSFVRKEAVISSQIEGTQATLLDLLSFEAEHTTTSNSDDVQEICNTLEAMTFAIEEIAKPKGLPISVRLLNATHKRLMKGVRGQQKAPGQVRRSQNWIGGTRPGNALYVPPPANRVRELLADLERYIHSESDLSPLIRAGLVHVQFESIHPYLDGNGRLGRLLIALLLTHWGLLSKPLLYLSLFFKTHREEYYRCLNAVRTDGDFETWIKYFLEGVATVANEAVHTTKQIFSLVAEDRSRVLAHPSTTLPAVQLFEQLAEHPIINISNVIELLKVTRPTASKAVSALTQAKVLKQISGGQRDRSFGYSAYLDCLRTGTEYA